MTDKEILDELNRELLKEIKAAIRKPLEKFARDYGEFLSGKMQQDLVSISSVNAMLAKARSEGYSQGWKDAKAKYQNT